MGKGDVVGIIQKQQVSRHVEWKAANDHNGGASVEEGPKARVYGYSNINHSINQQRT